MLPGSLRLTQNIFFLLRLLEVDAMTGFNFTQTPFGFIYCACMGPFLLYCCKRHKLIQFLIGNIIRCFSLVQCDLINFIVSDQL